MEIKSALRFFCTGKKPEMRRSGKNIEILVCRTHIVDLWEKGKRAEGFSFAQERQMRKVEIRKCIESLLCRQDDLDGRIERQIKDK